jgi:surface protein
MSALRLVYDVSANQTIGLYLSSPNVTINWGDGSSNSFVSVGALNVSYTYNSAGTYTINIDGSLNGFGNAPGSISYAAGIERLVEVNSFGSVGLTYCNFQGATNLTVVPTSIPSSITNAYGMFKGCTSLNDSRLTDWVVSNITTMTFMFSDCTAFNKPIGNWNVGNVVNTSDMFSNATAFNQDISNWNVSNNTTMKNMFLNASSFNQNIGSWQITGLNPAVYTESAEQMFDNCGLSEGNFNSILYGWSQKSVNRNVILGASNVYYSASLGTQGYNTLVNSYGWTINTFLKPMRLTYYIPANSPSTRTSMYLGVSGTVIVNWGDSSQNTVLQTGVVSHTYASPGTYSAMILGKYTTSMYAYGNGYGMSAPNSYYLKEVLDYGGFNLTSLAGAFSGRVALSNIPPITYLAPLPSTVTNISFIFSDYSGTLPDITGWNTSNVTNMASAFQNVVYTSKFNQNIGGWNTSNVTNMDGMFSGCSEFNQPIGNWDVSKVTTMISMFAGCAQFNQDISNWNVGNVTNMGAMFGGAYKFNSPLANWNVGKVTNMGAMFGQAREFNQPINSWDVSKVTDFYRMFREASKFNQNIDQWNMASVRFNGFMDVFAYATSFDQNLGALNISRTSDLYGTFAYTGWSPSNLGKTLYGWAQQNVTGVRITTNQLYYDASGFIGYNILTGSLGWNIPSTSMKLDTIRMSFAIPSTNRSTAVYLGINSPHSVTINWGDSSTNVISSTQGIQHTYPAAGTYAVEISSTNPSAIYQLGDPTATYSSRYLTQIVSWGAFYLTSLAGACNSILGTLTSAPAPPTTVTDMNSMFRFARDMSLNVSNWDVSKVTNMSYMFSGSTSQSSYYSPDISGWNTGNVTNMSYMFASNKSFNRTISSWNTGNVTNMSNMFYDGSGAVIFNQNLGNWDVTQVTNMANMLSNTGLTSENFGNTLYSWSQQNLKLGVELGASGLSLLTVNGILGFTALGGLKAWNITGIQNLSLTYAIPTPNTTVELFLTTPQASINWGDGSFNSAIQSGLVTAGHVYSAPGTYAIKIFGTMSGFGYTPDAGDYVATNIQYLTSVSDFGVGGMSYCNFRGASSLTQIPNSIPTGLTNLRSMFAGCSQLNDANLLNWQVSSVTNMSNMFAGASTLNRNFGGWNIANVTDMSNAFSYSGIDAVNFGTTLYNWSLQSVQPNVNLGAIGLNINDAGYQGLLTLSSSPKLWNITGWAYFPTSTTQFSGYSFSFSYLNSSTLVTSGHVYKLKNVTTGETLSTFSPTGTIPIYTVYSFNNLVLFTSGITTFAIQDASNNDSVVFQTDITFNIICFREDTKILCLKYDKEEYVPIQNLRKGCLVKTRLSGYVPIDMIGKTNIYNEGVSDRIKDQLYVCKRDQYPDLFEDLYITGAHSILVDKLTPTQKAKTLEFVEEICVTEDKYRLMAFIDERAVPFETKGNFTIYHIALANDDPFSNYGVYANGLLVESCSKRCLKELSNMTIL